MKRLILALLLLAACDDPTAWGGPPNVIENCVGGCGGWTGKCFADNGLVYWCECAEISPDWLMMVPEVCCESAEEATCDDDFGCECKDSDQFVDADEMIEASTGAASLDGDHFEDDRDMVEAEAEGKPSCLELCPDIPVHCGCFIRLGLCWAACK